MPLLVNPPKLKKTLSDMADTGQGKTPDFTEKRSQPTANMLILCGFYNRKKRPPKPSKKRQKTLKDGHFKVILPNFQTPLLCIYQYIL